MPIAQPSPLCTTKEILTNTPPLLKGAYNERPHLPKYTCAWDVQKVLDYLVSLGENSNLSRKTVMLLGLKHPSRSGDLSQLGQSRRHYRLDGVTFLPTGLARQSRQSKTQYQNSFFPHFQRILFNV